MSTPTYNLRDIKKILKMNGWTVHHQKGSHIIYKNEKGEHLTIAICNNNKMIMQRLIKEHNLMIMQRLIKEHNLIVKK